MHRHGSLNHIYRLVWSHVLNAWVAVAETSRGRGKGSRRKLAAVLATMTALALGGQAQAAPTGGQVVAGTASITQNGSTTTITQSSQQTTLNWSSFNVGGNETVNFVQPSASALAVNRIYDNNGSQILGRLNANGQVYLVNPNGILFGRGAQVNVGGLVASTLELDSASTGGKKLFSGNGSGSVVNQGSLQAADGGYIALLGRQVSNQGVISARLGTVALGAGSAATLSFDGARLLQLQIEQSTLNNLAENGGLIRADGGQVLMSAGARDSLLASVVNNTGVIEARSVEQHEGSIVLLGGMRAGSTQVAGTLDASAPAGGNGGFIETSAAHVKITDQAHITTAAPAGHAGTWLIDPVDFTIAASGGDISGTALSINLRNNNVVIQSTQGSRGTNGDVNVNDSVSWSANKLTLNAQRNINLNATLNGSGKASLALEYGQGAVAAGNTAVYQLSSGAQVNLPAGQNFSTKLGSDGVRADYTVITSLGAAGSVTGTDLQGIDGKLDGKYVLGADIDASAAASWKSTYSTGFSPIGGDTGFSGVFDGLGHSITQLSMRASRNMGSGLFGISNTGALIQNVGLSGGNIWANYIAGGLVGVNNGTIRNSYAALDVGSISGSGGLTARNTNTGIISNSYATGAVSGDAQIGGLVGSNNGKISNSYATGSVTGGTYIGSLVGLNWGYIDTGFATGHLNVKPGGYSVGGLIGETRVPEQVTNSYWSISGTGQTTSAAGTGLSDVQMRTASSYRGFNFTTTPGATGNNWVLVDADGSLNNAGGAAGATYPMLASEYSKTIYNAHQLQLMAMAPGAAYVLGANIDASATAGGKDVWGSSGFIPVGTSGNLFKGSLDGQNHSISGLTINLPESDYIGLIGFSDTTSTIRNIGLLNGNVTGRSIIGGLVGYNSGNISNSYSAATVNGDFNIGGLIGINQGNVSNSYASGSVSATAVVGGLVGQNSGGIISNTFSTSKVNGEIFTGLLVGNNYSQVKDSYWKDDGKTKGVANNIGILSNTSALSDAQLHTQASFSGWDMASTGGSQAVWRIYEGVSMPSLRSFLTPLTITSDATSKTYDGRNYTGGLVNAQYSIPGAANSGQIQSATANPYGVVRNAGTYNAIGTYLYSGQQGYDINLQVGALTINPAIITLNGSRSYDSGTSMAASLLGLSGLVNGEKLLLSGSGILDNKNAGTGKKMSSGTLALADGNGGLASNYTLAGGNHQVTIYRAMLNVQGVGAANKGYDTTTDATLTGTAKVTALGNDQLSVAGGNAHFADKNAGIAKTVIVDGYALQGADAANYTLVQPSNIKADISKANVVVTGVGAANKVYDATTSASLTGTASVQALANDQLSLTGGNTRFADKNAGTAKTVIVDGYALQGADAANYALVQPGNITADISKANVIVTGVGAANKVYDATTGATLTGTANVAAMGDDQLSLTGGTARFADKNAGAGKTVIVDGYALQGADASNYALVQPGNITADISKVNVLVTGVGAANKVYDASTGATLTGKANVAALGDDQLNLAGGTARFADKNAGIAKTVIVDGYALQGTDAANYALVQPGNITADISKANIVVTGVGAANKVYDATTGATLTGTANLAALGDDQLNLAGGTARFADKNAGAGKTVIVDGYALQGADASNYALVQPGNITADISKANVIVTGVGAANKVYDTTIGATLTGKANVVALGDDQLSLAGGTARFADKNAGAGKTVIVDGYALQGADAANYALVQPGNIKADISKANVVVTGVGAANKVYDATTGATLTGKANVAALGDDQLSLAGGTARFADKNAGIGKAVIVDGYALQGADAANYALVQPGNITADISKVNVIVTGVGAANKVYDATTGATLTGKANVAALGDDQLSLAGGTARFVDKNAGTGKTVIVDGYALQGADAGNYALVQPGNITADISKANVIVTGVGAANKVYDATTGATLTGKANVATLGDDQLSLAAGTARFADKNAGAGKTVIVDGYALQGADAANYALVQPGNITADISKANVIVTGVGAANKVYDATTGATLTGKANVAALGDDQLSLAGGTARFADKNAGAGKAVIVDGYALQGADAGNYALVQPGNITADISKANVIVTGVGAANKVYDATTGATLTGKANVATLGDDQLSLAAGTARFADKNAGAGKTVIVDGYALQGADAANYALVQPGNITADISKANVIVIGVGAANKVYDATTGATLTGTANVAALGSDQLSLAGGTARFADKNAGIAKTVIVDGYALQGADAANYALLQPGNIKADISKANVIVTGVGAANKVYDATTGATLTGKANVAALGSDQLSLAGGNARFADKNAGTGKAVIVDGYALQGADAANYALVQPSNITADISKANVIVTGVGAANKVYDASTAVTLTGTASVKTLGGDQLSVAGGNAHFADQHAGTGKAVIVDGYNLQGKDAGNYTIVQPSKVQADISKASLVYTATPLSVTGGRTPDGLNGTVSGLLGNDSLASATSGTLAWISPATATSPAGIYAVSGSGLSAQDYDFVQAAGNTTALTLKSASLPQPGQAVVAQLQTHVLGTTPDTRPGMLSTSPGLSVTSSQTETVEARSVQPNTTIQIGSRGAALQIVLGGLKLPADMLNVHQ